MMPRSVIFHNAREAAQALHDSVRGGPGWYVGIAADPRDRLFRQHRVNPYLGRFDFVCCSSSRIAREAERILLASGYEGGGGGGDDRSVWVYAYKITRDSCEQC